MSINQFTAHEALQEIDTVMNRYLEPIGISKAEALDLIGEIVNRYLAVKPAPRHIKVIVHACEIWSGGAKLAIATSDAIAEEISAALNAREVGTPTEEMIRFCPECGCLGDIPVGYEACCPDWSHARIVPKRFAELCAETFRLCVSKPYPNTTDEHAVPPTTCKAMPSKLTPGMRAAMLRIASEYTERTSGNSLDAIYEAAFAAVPSPAPVAIVRGNPDDIGTIIEAVRPLEIGTQLYA